MADNTRGERYVLRSFSPSNYTNKKVQSNNTFSLSNIGLNWDRSLVRSSLAVGTTESNKDNGNQFNNVVSQDFYDTIYAKAQDITRINNDYIAFFDRDYSLRRSYLRNFSQQGEINSVIEMIADESIVPDSQNYFLRLNLKPLKSHLKKTKEADKVLDGLNEAFNRVYQMYGWTDSNDAWAYMKKFLVDGFLAFEILFSYEQTEDEGIVRAKDIIGFKELDPTSLQPDIVHDEASGQDIKIWWQYKDDPEKERRIPDAHLIYISWQHGNFEGRISYLEGLTRTFNMLRQLENSRIIWNIQNAQKRIKIVVPIGTAATDRAQERINELKAYYNEETQIDDQSGEMTVNGQPKFSFTKTFIFPSKEGTQTEISEMGVEGYDLNSTEQLKYWWRRFIMETRVPANRFMLDPTSSPNNPMNGDANITREEYTFSRFIKRLQSIFKELILKPVWIQFCLKFPLFATSEVLRTLLAVEYNAENTFELAKERAIINDGMQTVQGLAGLKDAQGMPFFAIKFLVQKYLGISESDLKNNEDMKLAEAKANIMAAVAAAQEPQAQNGGGAMGGAPMGGGMDDGLGGADMMGGAPMGGGMDSAMGGGMEAPMGGGADMSAAPMGGGADMSGGMM